LSFLYAVFIQLAKIHKKIGLTINQPEFYYFLFLIFYLGCNATAFIFYLLFFI